MTPIEKVARAICESVGPEGSSDARSQMGDWPAWHDWVPQARAAIDALADAVTSKMGVVLEASLSEGDGGRDLRGHYKLRALSAAIRSAKGG